MLLCYRKKLLSVVLAGDIREKILELANQRGTAKAFNISEVARRVDPVNWKTLTEQVRLVASILIREGKIKALNVDNSDCSADIAEANGPVHLIKTL